MCDVIKNNNIPFQLYFQPPAIKQRQKKRKIFFLNDSLKTLLDECTALKKLVVVFPGLCANRGMQRLHRAVHGGVEGHIFHMHVITLHEFGVAQWGEGRGAMSVNTP